MANGGMFRWLDDSVTLAIEHDAKLDPSECYDDEHYPDDFSDFNDLGKPMNPYSRAYLTRRTDPGSGENVGSDMLDVSVAALRTRHALAAQPCLALGRRPKDWWPHDLLAMCSFNDPRNWMLRAVNNNPSDFLVFPGDNVEESVQEAGNFSNADAEKRLRSCRTFDYCHRLQLAKYIPKFGFPNYHPTNAAIAAFGCPTSLFQTSVPKRKYSNSRNSGVCSHSWICPHCYAREARRVMESALGKLVDMNSRMLILLVESVPIDELEPSNTFSIGSIGLPTRKRLLDLVQRMGGTGGIWTQQVCPATKNIEFSEMNTEQQTNFGLEARVGVMAAVPNEIEKLEKLRTFGSRPIEGRQSFSHRVLPLRTTGSNSKSVEAAIRSVLIGGCKHGESYIPGLFYWPPVGLLTREQWLRRYRLTRRQPTYRHWGTLAEYPSKRKAPAKIAEAKPKVHQTSIIYAAIRDLYGDIDSVASEIPGRQTLRRQLAERGIQASEREVRAALKEVKQLEVKASNR